MENFYSRTDGWITIPPCSHCGMPMNGPHLTTYCPGDPTAVTRLLAIVEEHERRLTAVEQRMDEIERMYGGGLDGTSNNDSGR